MLNEKSQENSENVLKAKSFNRAFQRAASKQVLIVDDEEDAYQSSVVQHLEKARQARRVDPEQMLLSSFEPIDDQQMADNEEIVFDTNLESI